MIPYETKCSKSPGAIRIRFGDVGQQHRRETESHAANHEVLTPRTSSRRICRYIAEAFQYLFVTCFHAGTLEGFSMGGFEANWLPDSRKFREAGSNCRKSVWDWSSPSGGCPTVLRSPSRGSMSVNSRGTDGAIAFDSAAMIR